MKNIPFLQATAKRKNMTSLRGVVELFFNAMKKSLTENLISLAVGIGHKIKIASIIIDRIVIKWAGLDKRIYRRCESIMAYGFFKKASLMNTADEIVQPERKSSAV